MIYKVKPRIFIDPFDDERLVVPSIVYVRKKLGEFQGVSIVFGWWKWGAGVSFMWNCEVLETSDRIAKGDE